MTMALNSWAVGKVALSCMIPATYRCGLSASLSPDPKGPGWRLPLRQSVNFEAIATLR
jgi:hypothetical protein